MPGRYFRLRHPFPDSSFNRLVSVLTTRSILTLPGHSNSGHTPAPACQAMSARALSGTPFSDRAALRPVMLTGKAIWQSAPSDRASTLLFVVGLAAVFTIVTLGQVLCALHHLGVSSWIPGVHRYDRPAHTRPIGLLNSHRVRCLCTADLQVLQASMHSAGPLITALSHVLPPGPTGLPTVNGWPCNYSRAPPSA